MPTQPPAAAGVLWVELLSRTTCSSPVGCGGPGPPAEVEELLGLVPLGHSPSERAGRELGAAYRSMVPLRFTVNAGAGRLATADA